MSLDEWWGVMESHHFDGHEGLFIHPVQDEGVMAGNGTIGLELIEDLPDVDTVVVPVGGGGLITGIASAVKACDPACALAAEPETGAPVTARSAAARASRVHPPWVDGAGSRSLIPAVWEHLAGLSTARSSCRSPTPPRRCGCSPSVCG